MNRPVYIQGGPEPTEKQRSELRAKAWPQPLRYDRARLRQVIDHIKAHPESWDQTNWHCGTTHCLAGHAQLMSGQAANIATTRLDARVFLRLSTEAASWLFSPARSMADFEDFLSDGYRYIYKDGYNSDGYDRDGYDRAGYDRFSYDRDGYDRAGYDRDGYDRAGYDRFSYDRDGYDRAGYDRFSCDRKGYDRNGYDEDGLDRNFKLRA